MQLPLLQVGWQKLQTLLLSGSYKLFEHDVRHYDGDIVLSATKRHAVLTTQNPTGVEFKYIDEF